MTKHLLGIEQLTKEELLSLIRNGDRFVEIASREIKKVPSLRGKTIINLFLEPSTRTRASFEIAGKRLSADTINISSGGSSISKGENLLDTVQTLESMSPDIIVIRHGKSGAPHFLAQQLKQTSIINAGDGIHEHPTQALLDCLSLWQHFGEAGMQNLNVAIVGDILHSRVARSNIYAHKLLGNKVRLVAPPTLLPNEFIAERAFGSENLEIVHDLRAGLEGADVVLCLRMQLERMEGNFVPSLEEYSREYCVNEKLLSSLAPNSVVLHPGPVNRGVEVSGEVAYGKRSLVNKQVANGVAIRMAVLFKYGSGSRETLEEVKDD